jgi:hypothetical protein
LVNVKNEAAKRFILNLFLVDILNRAEFFGELKFFAVANGNKKRKITGKIDYTVALLKLFCISFQRPFHQKFIWLLLKPKQRLTQMIYGNVLLNVPLCIRNAGKAKKIYGILSSTEMSEDCFGNRIMLA